MERLLVLLIGLSFTHLLSAEEMDLVIPSSPKEMEKVLSDEDPCDSCGVVTGLRQTKPKPDTDSSSEEPYTVTIVEITRDGLVSESPDTNEQSVEPWQITIRYDNETIVHEQNTRPSVEVGDRVQVISGRVVLR